MSIELKTRFNQLAMANRYPELSDEQWAILVEGEGQQGLHSLTAMVAKAGENVAEAIELFKGWHKAIRLTDTMRAHGFPDVTKREAKALFEHVGQERVGNTALALRNGDAQAKALMARWLADVRGNQPAPTPAPSRESAPASTGNQRFSAVPPPPGVVTGAPRASNGQGNGNGQSNSPSQGNRAPEGNNVTRLPAADRRPEDRRDSRPAPRQDQRADARQNDRYDRQDRYEREGGDDATGRHNAPPSAAQRPADAANGGDRQYDQHSCFGRDVAVTFECTPNRERTALTVNIKVAKAKSGTCKQGVDWKNGIIIALEPHEVQTVAAVLLGMGPTVRYAGHGHDNQKWFELAESTGDFAGALRLTMAHGQDRRSVNIGATDIGEVAALFMRALQSSLRIDPSLIPGVLRRAYDLYAKNAARKGDRSGGQQQRAQG